MGGNADRSSAGPAAAEGRPAAKSRGHRGFMQIAIFLRRTAFANWRQNHTALRAHMLLEHERGTGFILLPVFMGIGALIYFVLPVELSWWVLLSAVLGLAVLARFRRNNLLLLAPCLALLMICAGMVSGKIETWRADTQMNGSAVTTRVTGQVVRIEHRPDGRVRLTFDIIETRRPTLRHAPDRMRSTARNIPAGLQLGDTIEGVVRIMPPSGPVNPGGYDFSFMNYFAGIGASGFFMGDPVLVARGQADGWRQAALIGIERLRLALGERARERIGGAEGEVAATLIAAVRSGIPEETSSAMQRTGLAHILAISGLHMGLVAVTVMVPLRLFFALFPRWASRYPIKKYAAFLALLACAFYLAMSGSAVAAQRAFIMLAVMLLALIFDRAALTMRNLAIAALIVLTLSPHVVVGPSFQMSFAATAALIGFYSAWSERRAKKLRTQPYRQLTFAQGMRRYLWLFFAALAITSIVSEIATSVYGVHHFYRVSPYSLPVNMLAMPIVSFIVMPAGVMAVLTMPFGFDGPFLDIMGMGLTAVIAIATWFAERTPLDAVGAMPIISVALFTLALLVASLAQSRLKLAALPLLLLGVVLLSERQLPHVLVSEDARLVAVLTDAGSLAVNRTRPNGFTIDNWVMAQAAEAWHRPVSASQIERVMDVDDTVFRCLDELCLFAAGKNAAAGLIVHSPDAAMAAPYCQNASLIVIDDATAQNPCSGAAPLVLTKRDMARRGSAAVYLPGPEELSARVEHAISEPFRPWHDHRRWSREARGLEPYQRD